MAEYIFQRDMSHASQLQQIRTRFRCTKDLHTYLSDNCGYLLPKASKCKLVFLQAILYGQKKVLKQKEVPAKTVPHWPGLTVKNVYPQVYEWPNVQDYLPNFDNTYPERDFFFKVLYTLHPDRVEDMIEQAGERRNKGQKNLQDRQWSVMMSPDWVNELLKHEFISDKKGRGSSSILISTMGQARMQGQFKRRKVNEEVDDQMQMNEQMNDMNGPMAGDDPHQMPMQHQDPMRMADQDPNEMQHQHQNQNLNPTGNGVHENQTANAGVHQFQNGNAGGNLSQHPNSMNPFGPERKNTFLEEMDAGQIQQRPQKQQNMHETQQEKSQQHQNLNQSSNQHQNLKQHPPSKKIPMPKLSGRAAQIMSSSAKKNKKRSENEYRSQGLLEVQEILEDHESKYGSAIGDQEPNDGINQQQQEEIKVGAGGP